MFCTGVGRNFCVLDSVFVGKETEYEGKGTDSTMVQYSEQQSTFISSDVLHIHLSIVYLFKHTIHILNTNPRNTNQPRLHTGVTCKRANQNTSTETSPFAMVSLSGRTTQQRV
jgi:hypothetical protein